MRGHALVDSQLFLPEKWGRSGAPRALLPQRVWTEANLLAWLTATQERNRCVKQSHMKRCLHALLKLTL